MADAHRDQFSAYDPFAKNVVREKTSIGFGESGRKGTRVGRKLDLPRIREKACAQREKERLLREAIRDLRQTIRRVVEIQQLREFSMKETARMMGVSVTAGEGAACFTRNGH